MPRRIYKVHGLNIYQRKHKRIKSIIDSGHYPEIHGDKVWFSSYFIMKHLTHNPPKPNSKPNILEIGCGWGLLSMFCAKKFDAKATAVDADAHVFPLLKLHARKNRIKVKTKIGRYEHLKPKLLAKQDLIVGADICFWDELVDPLFSVIKKAMKNDVKKIIIADPGRSPFLKLAKRCKKKYGAKLVSTSISKPLKKSGYLLIIDKKYRK